MTEEERDNLNEVEFAEYLRHVAPSKAEAEWAWGTAIGLQKVNGLTTSEQLRDMVRLALLKVELGASSSKPGTASTSTTNPLWHTLQK